MATARNRRPEIPTDEEIARCAKGFLLSIRRSNRFARNRPFISSARVAARSVVVSSLELVDELRVSRPDYLVLFFFF